MLMDEEESGADSTGERIQWQNYARSSSAHLNEETNELEEMEVPKCLGDIFESVAGGK